MFAFLRSAWFIQLLIIITLSLLIWFFGAFIAFADHKPWQSEIARLLTIMVIIVLWSLNNVRKLHRSHQNSTDSTEPETKNSDKKLVQVEETYHELDAASLTERFNEALRTQKLFTGQGSVYELPWYLLLGERAGKTSFMINSGLELPLNRSGRQIKATEDCSWYFTELAAFLDTPSRYTTQHDEDDKTLWQSLLTLLKKHRPRRPLNGIIITLSLADLLNQDAEERKHAALTLRDRLDDLYKQLGVRIPVYLVCTKTDLIAGFSEYFALLSAEQRAEVWGMTLTLDDYSTEQLSEQFDLLLNRLQQRLLKGLQEERDVTRRHLIFSFPQRMAELKPLLSQFLQDVYGQNRYQKSAWLRGVYFVSSMQQEQPIDSLMSQFNRSLKLARFNLPAAFSSKSYFIQRLLADVIIAESLLIGFNKPLERKHSLMRLTVYSLALALTMGMSASWFNSYNANLSLLNQFNQKLQVYDTASAKPIKDTDFLSLLPRINALRDVTQVYAQQPELLTRLGLYQGDTLQALAIDTYQQALQKQFLTMITARLEQRLNSNEASNPEVHYQLLKVYLMLGDPKKLEAGLMRAWLVVDWNKNYTAEQQAQLLEHLNALLALPPETQALNQRLVAASRQILTRIPIAQQLYMRIKSEALQAANEQDFLLSSALIPNGEKVFMPIKGSWAELRIPYLYTYNGFQQVFLKQGKELAEQSVQQNWVLGETFSTNTPDVNTLAKAMQVYYNQDFIQYWDGLLANLKMQDIHSLEQATDILEYASSADSPIKQLIQTIDKQTTLTRKPPSALDGLDKSIKDKRVEKLLDTVQDDDTANLGVEVEQHYQTLTAMLKAGADGKIPLDNTLATLGALYGYMIDLSNSANKGAAAKIASPANSQAVAQMQLEAARLPEPLKSMTQVLTAGNLTVMLNNSKNQLNQLWQTNVLPLYDSGLAWRYPFWRTSVKEVALQDFGRFFAKNGIADQFFSKNLQAFVDTTGKDWKLIKQDDQTVVISDAALLQFQYAEKIRQVFFTDGGTLPSVKFHLKPVSVGENVKKFWLNLEGQKIEYAKNTLKNTTAVQWPGNDGSLAVTFGFETEDGKTFRHQEEGAWAWFRVLDKANMQDTGRDSYLITFTIDELQATYELSADSIDNPFSLKELSSINFPLSLSP